MCLHSLLLLPACLLATTNYSAVIFPLSALLSPRPDKQMLASRLTAYFRKRCVTVTDRRVRLMNEILSCIKFIKMYCWEDAFAQNIHSKQLCSAESPASDSAAFPNRRRHTHFLSVWSGGHVTSVEPFVKPSIESCIHACNATQLYFCFFTNWMLISF